jgi:hypothetical protein
MEWPTEDPVSALLSDRPKLGSWLFTIGIMALGMTPLGLILGGIWGALLTSAFFVFVWLASMVWVFVRHGSLGFASVLTSAIMVIAWPGIIVLSGVIR